MKNWDPFVSGPELAMDRMPAPVDHDTALTRKHTHTHTHTHTLTLNRGRPTHNGYRFTDTRTTRWAVCRGKKGGNSLTNAQTQTHNILR